MTDGAWPMKRVLVLGATGFVGRSVCAALASRQVRVRVLTRDVAKAQPLSVLPAIEVLAGSPHDDAMLARAIAGMDAVVNLVGILHESRHESFQRAHVDLPARVAQACRSAGVPRLLHMSALKADPQGPSAYLRSRGLGEAAVWHEAGDGNSLAVTVLRPSVIFGQDDQFVNLFAAMARVAPLIPLAGARSRFQPVWVEDVARAVCDCLADRRSAGQTYELCGPEAYALGEIVSWAAKVQGLRRIVAPLPTWAAYAQAWVLEHLPGPLMTRDNLRSMSVDNVCGCSWPAVFGFAPSAMAEVVPRYLAGAAPRDRYAALRERRARRGAPGR